MTTKFPKEPSDRIVILVHYSLLQRNDCVIRNRNAFGTYFGATFCDIAVADSLCFGELLDSVFRIERMHFERRHVYEEARSDEFFVLVVLTQDVAYVLTQKAFNALSKFLNAIHIFLLHAPASIRPIGRAWLELLDLFFDPKIPGNVGDKVLDRGKSLHRLDRHRLFQRELVKPGHAHQSRHTVDLGRTG